MVCVWWLAHSKFTALVPLSSMEGSVVLEATQIIGVVVTGRERKVQGREGRRVGGGREEGGREEGREYRGGR